MLPGERITLIKKIAERFAASEPEDIQLTLGQFGVTYQPYSGDDFTFDSFRTALHSIEHAPDDTLLGLHAYFISANLRTMGIATWAVSTSFSSSQRPPPLGRFWPPFARLYFPFPPCCRVTD